ncbi:MAG: hypothetical protein U5R49_00450 [Deltaproteobacteria bacterium]|nr:hypothetical protein [Deltaproteobacteria bacterium]
MFLGVTLKASGQEATPVSQAAVVWPEYEGGKFHIYYSARFESGWSDKQVLSDSVKDVAMPSVARGYDGVSWVVWSACGENQSSLFYRYSTRAGWSEAEEIPTNLRHNSAPSILVDKDHRPWIVWQGNDGKNQSDIFFSRWDGKGWEPASKVNRGDDSPDVLPLIGTKSNGVLWVSWYGFDGTRYNPYCSEWAYDQSEAVWRWSDEIECDADNLFKVQINRGSKGRSPGFRRIFRTRRRRASMWGGVG